MVALLLLAACDPSTDTADKVDDTADTDSGGDDTGPVDPDTVPLAGECTDATHWGAFVIDSNEDYAAVSGSVINGVVPASILTNMLTTGECTIWRRENPFCDPGCEPGYVCDFDGSCIPYPTGQAVGTVTLDGLSVDVTMEPVPPSDTYFFTDLDNPPWTPGEVLTLSSSGGTYEPFRLHGVTPTPFAPVTMDWTLVPGEAFSVAWDPPVGPVRTEVVVTLSIDQHGTTPSNIECVFADDGGGEVPADVLDSLMEFGVSGFPAGNLYRRTMDSTTVGDGCVDFAVTDSRLAFITISGYTPCRDDRDCPEGLECNEAMERCEEIP